MRKGNYSYENYLGFNYFKSRSYYYLKDAHGILRLSKRCYFPTNDGNYIEFDTLSKCIKYIKAMSEVEAAKKRLALLVG